MNCPKCQSSLVTADGLTYCPRCAYEPPESLTRPAAAPNDNDDPPVIDVQSSAALGRGCVQRAEVIAAEIGKLQRAIEARKAEAQKLAKVAEFCEVPIPASVASVIGFTKAKGDRVQRQPRDNSETKNNLWTCPDCGHQTPGRWVSRHREECPSKAAAS